MKSSLPSISLPRFNKELAHTATFYCLCTLSPAGFLRPSEDLRSFRLLSKCPDGSSFSLSLVLGLLVSELWVRFVGEGARGRRTGRGLPASVARFIFVLCSLAGGSISLLMSFPHFNLIAEVRVA